MVAAVDPDLLERLECCTQLPSPPAIADQIIELSCQSDTNVDTLAEVVSVDPALTAKILRTTNSPMYARAYKTENLQQAVTLFGWNGMLNLALSFSLSASMNKNNNIGLDHSYYWQHSLASAVASRHLGKTIGYQKYEELFLPGLLQNIGMLAIDLICPEVYENLENKRCSHTEIQHAEILALNTDHAAIGAWVLEKWHLPKLITQLVAVSHDKKQPDVELNMQEAANCTALSDFIADCICCDEADKDYVYAAVMLDELLNFDMKKFLHALGQIIEEYQETAELFEINSGDPYLMEAIAEHAKVELAKND